MLNYVQCGHLIKILWHDGIGMSLYAERLERGRFLWPSPTDGCAVQVFLWPVGISIRFNDAAMASSQGARRVHPNPAMMRSSVVFPEPLSPTITTNSPRSLDELAVGRL